ncbi:hypothetical protein PVL30_000825 [Lodderomyces elongisporus]|uniref:Uncharacterized protein n=1 Tax=Lodderomyces elongisporus (strain ATCC 11503 / CBS 2605 / JCM 1781 / NBRC 1676 / NRRL YB-4239) TaxID=379508 RepID=A5DU21_LODEL|nr:uncharacterized protein PVL30_000825 [Lodderomyces elongisporus]EDK42679.1 conserved hypothetical protein [Lodderomyces elongisporus NRRL YB-4239]WLF77116.1 hypothetical protein PVL30_000825 [Lodderomyces elongisporus]
MVSFTSIATLAMAITSACSFSLLHDQDGYAILPPTDTVLAHLKSAGKKDASKHYEVVNTIHKNGEIVLVNLNTHEIKQTGKYKYNYDNSCYDDISKRSAAFHKRTIEDADREQCYNKEYELETSQCGFDFVDYNDASNCSSETTKYSCVLDIMKQQDATLKLKDMDSVPAQVRCYHKLSTAQSDKVTGGACSK